MTVRSAWHINPGQTRQDTRLTPIGTWAPSSATTTQAGVIPGGTPLALSGSGMDVTIGIGRAVAQGTAAQGAYPLAVTAAHTKTITNGHTSLPRIDRVFLVAYDSSYDSSGLTVPDIVVVPGTPATTPSAPTAVPNCTAYLALYDIRVEAGASAGAPIAWSTAVTDRRVYTAALGGIIPNGSAVGAYAGQWRDGGGGAGVLERFNGTVWEAALRLGIAGRVELGDVSLTRSGTAMATLTGGLTVTGVGGWLTAYKTVAQPISASTTMTNDTHLFLPLAANATYLLDGDLVYEGPNPTLGDIKMDWTIPAGATMQWAPFGAPISATTNLQIDSQDTANTVQRALGTFGFPSRQTARPVGRITTTGTAGALQLRWAQNTSNAAATTMHVGSWIRLHRVA
ncbi:hypothetical protein ACIQF6_14740 [Kitasatospora sp. NPDC092948]|uniref:hypothetical protein n=1 Tax=Kitasatospora sp. NPDC092948 TaxID=3364088 RepID=UPI00382FE4F5